jgi:hypothetical protein
MAVIINARRLFIIIFFAPSSLTSNTEFDADDDGTKKGRRLLEQLWLRNDFVDDLFDDKKVLRVKVVVVVVMVVVKLDDLVEAIVVVVVVVVVFVVFGFCTTLKGFSSVVVSQVVLNEVDTSNAIKIDLKKKQRSTTQTLFFQCCLGFVHIYLGFLKKSFGTVGVSLLFLATFRTMEQRLYYVARSPRIQQTVRLECTRA